MPHRPADLTHPKYRPDIDGLRALAILSVLGYHAFPERVSGGFIGVDIFFVISGYLISSIIFSNLEQESFSISEFYNRRIRRIFPALITVMLSSLAFGWHFLLADEYRQLGKHVAGGTGFISNFMMWGESGYFDNIAETKPMLHLWSLAIEEQFYIFWPLLLAFVWRRRWSFLRITAVIAVIAFVINIYYLKVQDPTAAFYSPISRFWELMAGGVLAYISLHRPELHGNYRTAQSLTGAALIVAGLLLINNASRFPGWWALLPTIGAFLLISAGPAAVVNRTILSNRTMVWFGLISYPLYLWHWPLLSFAKIIEGELSWQIRALLVVIAMLLAWLTFRWIERPLRFRKGNSTIAVLVSSLLITGAVAYSCMVRNGYEGHGFRDIERAEFSSHFENSLPGWRYFEREKIFEKNRQCDFYDVEKYRIGRSTSVPVAAISEECYTGDPGKKETLLIWGDSHAWHLSFGLRKNLPKNWQILQVTSSGCAPKISQHDSTTNYCDRSNWFALKTIAEQRPDVVLIAQEKGHKPSKMEEIGSTLRSMGVRTVIFAGPTPHWTSDLPKIVVRKLWDNTPLHTFVGVDLKVFDKDRAMKQKLERSDQIRYVSIIDYFCNRSGCMTYIGDDRMRGITSWDYGHLTPIASDALARDLLAPMVISANAPADISGTALIADAPGDGQRQ